MGYSTDKMLPVESTLSGQSNLVSVEYTCIHSNKLEISDSGHHELLALLKYRTPKIKPFISSFYWRAYNTLINLKLNIFAFYV